MNGLLIPTPFESEAKKEREVEEATRALGWYTGGPVHRAAGRGIGRGIGRGVGRGMGRGAGVLGIG